MSGNRPFRVLFREPGPDLHLTFRRTYICHERDRSLSRLLPWFNSKTPIDSDATWKPHGGHALSPSRATYSIPATRRSLELASLLLPMNACLAASSLVWMHWMSTRGSECIVVTASDIKIIETSLP